MKDLNQMARDNMEWEKRLDGARRRKEAERSKWDGAQIADAYEKLLARTQSAMKKPPLIDGKDFRSVAEHVAAVSVVKEITLEERLTPEDYAFLAGLKTSLGGPDGTN